MLSRDECYTAVLLECGPPPQHPSDTLTQNLPRSWYHEYNAWFEGLIVALMKYPATCRYGEKNGSNDWLDWYKEQRNANT